MFGLGGPKSGNVQKVFAFFGFFGSVIDSFLGATLQNRGILTNNGVNLASISISVLLSLAFFEVL